MVMNGITYTQAELLELLKNNRYMSVFSIKPRMKRSLAILLERGFVRWFGEDHEEQKGQIYTTTKLGESALDEHNEWLATEYSDE